MASASLILDRPEEVLNRPVYDFDPTPQFGPKFHFTVGEEIIVYPREVRKEEAITDLFSLMTIGIGLSLAFFSTVPRWQRVLVLLKLLD